MAAAVTVPQGPSLLNPPPALTPRRGVLTLCGYGIRVHVDRGHLLIEDGIGTSRRYARFARIGHGLKRLIIIGADGVVSLAALRWLADQKASLVMLDRDGKVLVTTGPVRSSDARLRRAQALAHAIGVAVPIARYLIDQKLAGQERIARERLDARDAAQTIADARRQLDTANSITALRTLESQGASAYWTAWQRVRVPFAAKDLARVPAHWRTFGARRSALSNGPRRAVNPPNAILNYLYAMLEAESRLAAAALGLDPGLGVMHTDVEGRDSLACDLMEAIRPQVDAWVLDCLMRDTAMRRESFFEQRDGNCRLMAPFAEVLAETALLWARAVAPIAEKVAQMLWTTARKPLRDAQLPARLTQRHHRTRLRSKDVENEQVQNHWACVECGAPLSRYAKRCEHCDRKEKASRLVNVAKVGRTLAHTPEAEARRAEARRRDLRAISEWKKTDQPAWLTETFYVSDVQPRLRTVTLSALATALGLSRTYVSDMRAGRVRPHPRHWLTLAQLVGVTAVGKQ